MYSPPEPAYPIMALVPRNFRADDNRAVVPRIAATSLLSALASSVLGPYLQEYRPVDDYQRARVYPTRPNPPVKASRPQKQRKQGKQIVLGAAPKPSAGFSINRAPAAVSMSQKNRVPKFNGAPNGIRIQHCEYIGPFTYPAGTNASFAVLSAIPFQPGLLTSYPWLSSLATNFEQYKFHRMRIVIRSIVPTSTSGAMYASIDYDAADPQPTTKSQFMNNGSAASSSIWETLTLDYDPPASDFVKQHYIRNGNLANNLDIKTYDSGNLYLAVDGSSLGASANTIADIFFEYDVSLFVPILNPDVAPGFALSGRATANATGALFTAPITYAGTNLATLVDVSPNNGNMVFTQQGRWLVSIQLVCTSTAGPTNSTWTVTSGSGSATLAAASSLPAAGSTGIIFLMEGFVLVTDTSVPLVVAVNTQANLSLVSSSVTRIASYPNPST